MRKKFLALAAALVASLAVPSAASPVPQPPELWTVTPGGASESPIATGPEGSFMGRDFEWSPDGSKIVFTKLGDIWIAAPDGSGQQNLTQTEAEEFDPHWSPDGTQIVFVRTTGDGSDLYLAAADGSGVAPLTTEVGYERMPRWSPTGEWILFQSTCVDCDEDLDLIRPDGSERVALTDDDVRDLVASWSPDGTQIAIVRGPGTTSGNELWIIDADATDFRLIAQSLMNDAPEWSFDGSWIAVRSEGRAVVVDVATGETRQPDAPAGFDTADADWAPTSLRLAFTEGNSLLVYDVTTGATSVVAQVPPIPPGAGVSRGAQDPDWSPDGSEIAFGHGHDLALVDADGTDLTLIVSSSNFIESEPRWAPPGDPIAFLRSPIPPSGMRSVNLVASRNTITFDATFRLGGSVTPGAADVPQGCIGDVTVTLFRMVLGESDSEMVATTTTTASGAFKFEGLPADRGANYVAILDQTDGCSEAASQPEPVNVRKKVTLSGPPIAGGRVRLKADVEPCKGHRGDKVLLQKRKGGRWVTVDRDRSDDRCRAVFVQEVGRRSVFRAKAPKTDPDHLAGKSPTLVIHVD